MKKRATTSGVQMFSFLDAMICTLGALLVLLHAFARHGQIEAVRKAEAKASQEVQQDTQPEKEILDWRIEQLKQVRAKTEAQLADQRLRLAHVEDHERRLQEKLRELKIAVDELAKLSERGDQRQVRDQAKLEAARVRLTEARAAVEEARKRGQQAANYSVVPYEGLNRTHRRPVYVECREDCMILQPEGVRLEPGDFAGYLGPGNPLASSMRGAREYYARTAASATQDADTEPYPLLLVRPDGVATYYAARSALESWGSDFGYEMIGADWKLKFDAPDPRLADLFNRIVADSRMRMRELMVATAHLNSMRPRTTLRASSSGGFVEERGGSGGGSGRSRGGHGGGWDSLDSDWARGSNPGGSGMSDRPGGVGYGTGPGNGGTTQGGAIPGADGPGGTLAQGANAGNGGTELKYPSGTKGMMPGEPSESYGGGSGAGSDTGAQAANRYSAARGGNGTGEHSGTGDQAQSGGTASQAGPKGGYARDATASDGADSADGSPLAGSPSGGASSGATKGTAASGGTGGSASSSSPSSSASMSHGGSSAHASKAHSLAKMRGRDWGLPDAGAGMSPVTRQILVRLDNERLVIVPEDRRAQPQETRLGATAQENIDEFVSNVWQYMKGWGIAGRGFYWRPTLVVEVAPGAEQRFAEVKGLLDDSGLEVRERVPRAAYGPRTSNPAR